MNILIAEPDDYSQKALDIYKQMGDVINHKKLSREELLEQVKDANILVIRLGHKIDKEILDQAKNLKIIACPTTGLDNIDLNEANTKGVQVVSLKGETEFLSTVTATAELAWGLMLALIRKKPWAFDSVKSGHWDRDSFKGTELRDKTLGIIGCGRLGKMMVRYGNAFFMKVTAYDNNPEEVRAVDAEPVSLEELLHRSDLISLHVPLNSSTENMIGEKEFFQMKDSSVIINASRGAIINEAALLDALKNKNIAGAAIDVMENEEATGKFLKNNPLVEYAKENSNLLIVPHIGGATKDSMWKTEEFIANKTRGSVLGFLKLK